MAPIRAPGQLLASTLNSHSTSSSLTTRSLQIRHALSTIPVPSSPLHTPITPSIAFHRVARVFLEHFNIKRDDSDSKAATSNKYFGIIFAGIGIVLLLAPIWNCTRDHFRKGGTWKTYAKRWYKAAWIFLLITVFLPLTILGCFLYCRKARKDKRNGIVRNGRGAVPAVAANPLAGSGAPPPPINRPQMPLDPVVVMPDLPDQEDPDAVLALPPPPPPILQKNETTDEATDRFLQENEK